MQRLWPDFSIEGPDMKDPSVIAAILGCDYKNVRVTAVTMEREAGEVTCSCCREVIKFTHFPGYEESPEEAAAWALFDHMNWCDPEGPPMTPEELAIDYILQSGKREWLAGYL